MNVDVPVAELSAALDEIYRLRAALALEAQVVEEHLALKSFPKSRRGFAEEQVERMRAAARGDRGSHSDWRFAVPSALRDAGASESFTRHQLQCEMARLAWERQGDWTTPEPREPEMTALGWHIRCRCGDDCQGRTMQAAREGYREHWAAEHASRTVSRR